LFRAIGLSIPVLLALSPAASHSCWAGSAWDEIRDAAFGDRPIEAGNDALGFRAPDRALDQRTVPISVDASLVDGRKIRSVTFVVDENPSPIGAVFRFPEAREHILLSIDLRLDQPSTMRAIVETS